MKDKNPFAKEALKRQNLYRDTLGNPEKRAEYIGTLVSMRDNPKVPASAKRFIEYQLTALGYGDAPESNQVLPI